jgi:predicted sulfurtransferase
MGKILLFYKYVKLVNPKAISKWQRKLCDSLNLTGRILIGDEGINGTVGGQTNETDEYKKQMLAHELFADIDFKDSQGDASCFPRMQITVREEIVTMGKDKNEYSQKDGGIHLTPEETHELISSQPKNLVILDARNQFEAEIGKFTNAIIPDIHHFREFYDYIEKNADKFKDKQVLMYCTGGIRCERASTVVKKHTGAKKVFQMLGGIHRYTEKYPQGYFRGKNYVFDRRIALKVNDDILSSCMFCSQKCDEYTNCLNASCNKHFICCGSCKETFNNTCSKACKTRIEKKEVHKRSPLVTKQYSNKIVR